MSANDPRLHFGLGSSEHVEQVEVRWPSGRIDRWLSLPAGTGYLLARRRPDASSPDRIRSARRPLKEARSGMRWPSESRSLHLVDGFERLSLRLVEDAHRHAGGGQDGHGEPSEETSVPRRGDRAGRPIERKGNGADHIEDDDSSDGAQETAESGSRESASIAKTQGERCSPTAPTAAEITAWSMMPRIRSFVSGLR